jgi:hypothetical protein
MITKDYSRVLSRHTANLKKSNGANNVDKLLVESPLRKFFENAPSSTTV